MDKVDMGANYKNLQRGGVERGPGGRPMGA